MPVLAIGGGAASGSEVARSLRPTSDDLTEVVIADASHWLIHEQPDRVATELLGFFAAD